MHRNKNCFATMSKEYKIGTKYVQCLAFFCPLVLIKLITEESEEN